MSNERIKTDLSLNMRPLALLTKRTLRDRLFMDIPRFQFFFSQISVTGKGKDTFLNFVPSSTHGVFGRITLLLIERECAWSFILAAPPLILQPFPYNLYYM